MLNHLRFMSIKNAVSRNSSLKDVWFARKKKKTVLNVAAEPVYKPLTYFPELVYLLSLSNNSIGFKDIKNICLRLSKTLP
jgi:hypothetical protein